VAGPDRERATLPPNAKVTAFSATVPDGVLYVLRVEMPPPENAPQGARGPVVLRVSHARGRSGADVALTGGARGRPVSVPELQAVIHAHASGRLMALMLDGGGTPVGVPMFYELVEIAGAVVAAPDGPKVVS
jgi:hypothetical protein